MSSKYLRAHLPSRENAEHAAHASLIDTPTATADAGVQASEAERQAVGPPGEKPGRFQPGLLSPLDEGRPRRSLKLGGLRVFDGALLAAEVISALVVAWLVAQYVYTAYIYTSPRRVVAPPAGAPQARQQAGISTPPATRTASPTLADAVVVPQTESAAPASRTAPEAGNRSRDETRAESTLAVPSGIAAPEPAGTPTVEPALLLPARLRIPVMFLDSPVHEVTINMGQWEVSPMDVGHHEGTANPGETGNVVLAGHRDINSALFRELDRLEPGDEVFVSNSLREYRYVVAESFVVGPKDTEVMDPTDDKRVTLITCTPVGLATQRLIVTAILDDE